MNNGSSKKDSGGIEVVADQADDGSYELRFEKQRQRESETSTDTPPFGHQQAPAATEKDNPAPDTGVWRAQEVDTAAPNVGNRWQGYAFGAVLIVSILVVAFVVAAFGRDQQPTTVDVEEPAFQGVFVDTPPLVIDEMIIVEEAADVTDDVSATPDAVQRRAPNAAALRIRSDQTGARGPDEPVIDDVVRSALENVAREDERQREEELQLAAERQADEERRARELREIQERNEQRLQEQLAEEQQNADEFYEDDEYYDDEADYEDGEYYDDEYPLEGNEDYPGDNEPLDEAY